MNGLDSVCIQIQYFRVTGLSGYLISVLGSRSTSCPAPAPPSSSCSSPSSPASSAAAFLLNLIGTGGDWPSIFEGRTNKFIISYPLVMSNSLQRREMTVETYQCVPFLELSDVLTFSNSASICARRAGFSSSKNILRGAPM